MRLSFSLTFFALISSFNINTIASPTTECISEYCPAHVEHREAQLLPKPTPAPWLTNGERLARGLPINPPTRRARVSARYAAPSSVPRITKRGVIKVTDETSGLCLGYISRNTCTSAQYRYQSSLEEALLVQLVIKPGSASDRSVKITAENSDLGPGFPFLALIQGRDNNDTDLALGSYQYNYIGGMANPGSPPDSVPVYFPANSYPFMRAAESDVWRIDLNTNTLTPRWINSDDSRPAIFSFSQGPSLYIGGDVNAFTLRYPVPVILISLSFVSL